MAARSRFELRDSRGSTSNGRVASSSEVLATNSRMASTAMREAISPLLCPPMQSPRTSIWRSGSVPKQSPAWLGIDGERQGGVVVGGLGDELADGVDGDARGDLTVAVPAHAVGDHEHLGLGIDLETVFVVAADHSDVGETARARPRGHDALPNS